MIGGEIVVNGNAHTGAVRMKGGKLTINGHFGKYGVHVPDQPCSYMEGGEVLVNGSCDSIGFRLAGGHLNINGECKGDLGAQLSGGYITLQGLYSGHCIGQHMASGTILLSDKGSPREIKAQPGNGSIGEEMNGGSIKFERTNIINFKVGPSMRGGSIVIEGNCCPEHIGTYSPIGIDMSYGKISIQGNTVGTIYLNRLQGGQININQSSDTARLYVDKSASSSKRGGQVYLNGERYYPFTLSFKNISQTFTRVRDVPRY